MHLNTPEYPAYCTGQPLVEAARPAIAALKDANLSVVTAESCTGGLIAAVLSNVQHASDCLHGGFVVYTKDNKAMALGVDRHLLRVAGSVDAEVAHQMAQGALERSPADVALSVTGGLGPDPDEDGNPPGLVWFGLCRRGGAVRASRHLLQGNPDEVRRAVVMGGLELLRRAAAG